MFFRIALTSVDQQNLATAARMRAATASTFGISSAMRFGIGRCTPPSFRPSLISSTFLIVAYMLPWQEHRSAIMPLTSCWIG